MAYITYQLALNQNVHEKWWFLGVADTNDVIQKIEKTLNNTHTTTQKLTNNSFRNTKKHPEKLREEITETVKRNPESSLYDLSHDIEYLDCIINESLRLNPPLAQVNRECVDEYKFNDIYILAGLQVIIPVYFLHRDPNV